MKGSGNMKIASKEYFNNKIKYLYKTILLGESI